MTDRDNDTWFGVRLVTEPVPFCFDEKVWNAPRWRPRMEIDDRDEFTDYANSQVVGERIVPHGKDGFKTVPVYRSEMCPGVGNLGCKQKRSPDSFYCEQCRCKADGCKFAHLWNSRYCLVCGEEIEALEGLRRGIADTHAGRVHGGRVLRAGPLLRPILTWLAALRFWRERRRFRRHAREANRRLRDDKV